MLNIFLIYGVHGDESIFGRYLAKKIKEFLELSLHKNTANIHIFGPYSRWSTKHSFHFSREFQDPNRLHGKSVIASNTNLPDLIICRNVFKMLIENNSFDIDSYLKTCTIQGADVECISTSSQSFFKDFLGYVDYKNWYTESIKRQRLIQLVKKKLRYSEDDPQCIFIDIHAGIGKPNSLSIIYKTHKKMVCDGNCFLVDGLARDLQLNRANFYVLEAGLKGSRKMLEKVILELHERGECSNAYYKSKKILKRKELKKWKIRIDYEIKAGFIKLFSKLLIEVRNL
jgi:hypothetical protein